MRIYFLITVTTISSMIIPRSHCLSNMMVTYPIKPRGRGHLLQKQFQYGQTSTVDGRKTYV